MLVLSIMSAVSVHAQNSMSTLGFGQKWVNLYDLDISGSQITVEAFILRQNNMNIVSKHEGTEDCNYLFRPNSFQLSTTDGFYVCLNTASLSINTWYHVAGTYDGSSIKYYVNGCLVNEEPATGALIVNDWNTAIGNRSNWPNGPEHFRGKIDEVRIWNSARTEEEIKLNMNAVLFPTAEPNLAGYYKFENNFNNIQGNSTYDGVGIGSPAFDVAPPLFLPFTLLAAVGEDLSCFESADGSITVVATGENVEYSIDGVTYQSDAIFSDLSAGTYTIFVRSGLCEETTEVILEQPNEIPNPNLLVNNPICSGDSLVLFTSSVTNASYFWSGPGGFTAVTNEATIQNIDIENSGEYSIYLEVDGCFSDTIISAVVVNPAYDITIVDTICSNETYVFGSEEISISGSYVQYLQSSAGCDSIVELSLTVNPSYSFVIDTSLCEGESITYEGLTMNSTGSYPFNLFTSLGCDSIITYELIVYPIPDAPQLQTNSPLSCPGDFFEVLVPTVEGGSYLWSGPNGFISTISDIGFNAAIEDMGAYNVTTTVDGCISPKAQTELSIVNIYSFEDFDLPNVVTPNGDGENDIFDLEAYYKTCEAYEALFFDRWGTVVYRNKENETPFSGLSLDGSDLMEGVYFYKIILENDEKQGFVQLIR